jgi:anti-sigma regulatory factor (Ser/Thr protein kinase)
MVRENLLGYAPEVVSTVELLTDELTTNAVLYGYGKIAVQLRASADHVRIDVYDTSPAEPEVKSATQWDEHGRGLLLVNRLSSRWGFDPLANGKAVWCEVSTSTPEDMGLRLEP